MSTGGRHFHGVVNRFGIGGRYRQAGGADIASCDGSVRLLRREARRLDIHISEHGLRQALKGEIVASEIDRRAIADLLNLVSDRGIIAVLIGLLLPAVQKDRSASSREG